MELADCFDHFQRGGGRKNLSAYIGVKETLSYQVDHGGLVTGAVSDHNGNFPGAFFTAAVEDVSLTQFHAVGMRLCITDEHVLYKGFFLVHNLLHGVTLRFPAWFLFYNTCISF